MPLLYSLHPAKMQDSELFDDLIVKFSFFVLLESHLQSAQCTHGKPLFGLGQSFSKVLTALMSKLTSCRLDKHSDPESNGSCKKLSQV